MTARTTGRSIWAVVAGFLTVAVLSTVTDEVLHILQVYPPWGQPMWDPKLNALALAYRIFFTILGGYLTARLAPQRPMRLVAILGIFGTIAGTVGAIVAISIGNFGPNWYPIALAVTAFPSVWLGGMMFVPRLPRDVAEQRL